MAPISLVPNGRPRSRTADLRSASPRASLADGLSPVASNPFVSFRHGFLGLLGTLKYATAVPESSLRER